MKSLVVAVVLAVGLPAGVLACPDCNMEKGQASTTAAAPQKPLAPGEARVTIPVSGMQCDHCVSRVKSALTKIDGVKSVEADLDKGQAVVTVEKGKFDGSKLVGAIDALGYKAGKPVEN